ncbi:hypothetical protein [Mycobacterium asiaticum]|uniref:hypothetical protein n=1 Tax=Mycobacterium asiaticum TaxID=1790 RepID=UPI0005618482|nr:hypothetical protein [Mycobacterium asiaticum]OBJ51828.1 hypothetical protein A9W94_25460 [Mycobacterium asiaticum]ORA10497.1 hypothetical protein BST16_21870 [Mycobacterium asiaticum DSM 44297]
MDIEGDWDVAIKTPIGTLAVQYVFTRGPDGLAGTATYKDETVALQNLSRVDAAGSTRLTWRQSVSKPMRLNLAFDVVFDGDVMAGHSRAGRLPRSAVTGRRRGA